MSRGSVVSTVTRLLAGQPRNCCLILGSSEAHSFSYLVSMRGSFSVAVKQPGQEPVYLPDVPTVFPCLHGVHRDTFTYINYFYMMLTFEIDNTDNLQLRTFIHASCVICLW